MHTGPQTLQWSGLHTPFIGKITLGKLICLVT